MTIKTVKPISKIDFIREVAKNSTKISDHMKDLILHRPKKDILYFYGKCETKADVEAKAAEIEENARRLLKDIGHEELITF